MLKTSSLRRIIISSIAFAITLLLCIFPARKRLYIPSEIIYIKTKSLAIYTLYQDRYIARADIIDNSKDTINYIIKTLTIDSNESDYLPNGFVSIIPKNTKLLSYNLNDGLLELNFSKEFLNISNSDEEKLIESLVYSLCELDNVNSLIIQIEGIKMTQLPHSHTKLPEKIDKSFGINKKYNIEDIKKTTKTVVYYISKYNDNIYYVPITKITNDKMEPIEIIINELKTTPIYDTNLISYLNASYQIKDYQILEDKITLSFDNKMLAGLKENQIDEKVRYSVALSLRDTYNKAQITINAT